VLDPAGIVRLDEAKIAALGLDLADRKGTGPAMVVAVRGFIDAGNAGVIAANHLINELPNTRIAQFDMDQLIDYRSHRGPMRLQSDRWTEYEEPYLALDYLRDGEGNSFLLLHGVEPDLQWERVIAAVRKLVDRFAVSLTVSINGIPMPVPHSRPLTLTARGTREELTEDYASFFNEIRVPSSLGSLLEFRLGEWGHDAMGFAIHVPHYLGRAQYPPASVFGLRHIERATGLDLRSEKLATEAEEVTKMVEAEASGSPEIQELVAALEHQYDRFTEQSAAAGLVGESGLIPSADELAAEFEKYLRQQDDVGK